MNYMRKTAAAGAAAVALLCLLSSTAAADANNQEGGDALSQVPAARNNPTVSREVIASLPTVIQNDADVYIAPDYKPGTPIIYGDTGKPVPGQTPEANAAAISCGASMVAPAGGAWYGPFMSNCAMFGSPGWQVAYTFSTDPVSSGVGCYQARGYSYSVVQNKDIEFYEDLGCQDGSYLVDWGNVLSTPAAKAKSGTLIIGWAGRFSH
jgi:hypothetical protein